MFYLELIKRFGPLVLAAVVATVITNWANSIVIGKLKNDIAQLTLSNDACVAANKESAKTNAELRNARDKAATLCQRQLDDKDDYINEQLKTCMLKGGGNDSHVEVLVSNSGIILAANDILVALGRMLPKTGDGGGDQVREGDGTARAAGAQVSPGDVVYCVSEVGAKSLIMDFAMCEQWRGECRDILSTYQMGSK